MIGVYFKPVLVNLFLLQVCLDAVAGSYWSEWSRWSECSRTCDGGARYKTRRCLRKKSYRYECPGERIGYATCNNDPCPSHLPDFRTEQCSAYNDASYSGYSFRWFPYHDEKIPCALSCTADGTNMIAILAPKVLDGTRCKKGSLDICINGKCIHVGCDHILHSMMETDTCGVCGGNNSTCQRDDSHVRRRHRWIQTDYGPCSVTCGVGVKDKRLLCFDAHKGRVMDSSFCENELKPSDTRDTCTPGACPPGWRVGPWQNCTRDCGGGVSWRIVTCVQTFENGSQQLQRDSSCDSITRPSARKTCNDFICPTWYAGEWSVCSVSCGTGVQSREVVCRHVGDIFCRDHDKPRTVKNCTTGITCYNLNGDIQERKVGQFGGSYPDRDMQGDQAITKEDLYKPRFIATTWDSCSASCGEGTRFRYVRCQVFLTYLDDFVDLADEDCLESGEERPEDREPCMIEPCYDLYEWVPDGMTKCSQTCLGGIQETILKCMTKENRTIVNSSLCIEASHVQTERRVCNDKPCPQRWDVREYGECSKTCGGGVATRTVKCIQEYAHGANILDLPDFMCSQPGPEREAPCNTEDCPALWNISAEWSKCSVTCGRGVQTRRPLCQRIRNGRPVNVTRNECDVNLKPETEKMCNKSECPEPMIKTRELKFFQLNKIPRLKLVAGMETAILPNTNVVMKCPHVGLDRQKVTWFKNGLKFRRSKRAKVARSGALRIRKALPGRDDAIYSCLIGGIEANISITFSSAYEVLQATVFREKFLHGKASSDQSLLNKTVLYKDPIDREKKPLTLISTDWSRCSVTCGGGLQSRNMSCELITEDYYEVVPKEECFRYSTIKPALIRSCSVNPCVEWRTGNWSECSDLECVRFQYSIQRRQVDCLNLFNNTATNVSYCSDLGFPPDNVRNCFHRNCSVKWLTSKWSECIADCDSTGFKARTFTCVWSGSENPSPIGSCDMLERPKATKNCTGEPCDSVVCADQSDYCAQALRMNMCRYAAFSQRCCKTCSGVGDQYYYNNEN